jgi:hypothetical protein
VILVGMTWNDTLCPEHRGWVFTLATLGLAGTIVAIVGLIQAWPMAPLFTVLVAACGVAIGLIDAVHDPTRGRLIALGFAACAVLGALLTVRAVPLALWERRVRRGLVPMPVPEDSPALEPEDAPPAEPEDAPHAVVVAEPEASPRVLG